MIETSFKVFKNGKAHTVDSSELFSSRRVLLCSIVRPIEFVTHHYVKYLADQKEKYQTHNIDLVLFTTQPWAAATMDTYFPEFETVLDIDHKWLSWLAHARTKTKSTEWLGRFWLFQALINHGKVEHFTEQPTENRIEDLRNRLTSECVKELLKINNGQGFWYLKKYLNESEELVFDRECFFEFGNEHMLYNLMFFNYLWPNNSLDRYLEIK